MEQVIKMLREICHQLIVLWHSWVGFLKGGGMGRKPGRGGKKERFVKSHSQRPIPPAKKAEPDVTSFSSRSLPPKTLMSSRSSSAEYEFLFAQLLDGVHQGWSQAQVVKFLEGLDEGIAHDEWLGWLRRFGDRLLASPVPNHELASRMVFLDEVGCGKLGKLAAEIGAGLLTRDLGSIKVEQGILKSEFPDRGVEECLAQGHAQLDRRQYPSALMSFQQAAELAPQNSQVLYGLGLACQRLGLYHEAIEQLSLALEFNPTDAKALTQRGLAYKALHLSEKAIADFEQAIAATPSTAEDCCGRGKALVELHRHEEGIEEFERASALNPSDQHAWCDRGNALYDLQHYEKAIASYDEAIKLQPDYAAACFNRGAALGNLQRYREAIAAFDRVLNIHPHDYHAWLSRGQTLDRLERLEDAIASYDQALKIRPDDPTAWRYRNDALSKLKSR